MKRNNISAEDMPPITGVGVTMVQGSPVLVLIEAEPETSQLSWYLINPEIESTALAEIREQLAIIAGIAGIAKGNV